jgi:RNA polymerase sigma-70 factor (ECF subfamily)
MVGIWQTAGTFNPALGSGRAWILRLARSRSIDRIRSVQRARDRDHAYAIERGRDDLAVDAVAVVGARADAVSLQAAMLELTAPQRQALVLAFFSAESYPQIADRLQVPLGTLKSRIRDALIKLRVIMDIADRDGKLAA